MNIVAILKQVPDTEAKISVSADGSSIPEDGWKYVICPFDEYGVEEALRLKEKVGGDSTVTVICVGPDRAMEAIRTALAMGVDKGIHVKDSALDGSDSIAAAQVLAAAIKKVGADIVFSGKQAIDFDRAQAHSAVAELLGWPQVNVVVSFEISDDQKKATARRRIEGGDEVVEVQLPAMFSCEKGLNEPRYASLPGIMKAKKKPVEVLDCAALSVAADSVGANGSRTRRVKYHPLAERKPGRMIEGEPAEQAKELARLLREEAKAI